MKKGKGNDPKKVVYLIGAGSTQAEAVHQGGEPVNLMMTYSKELGKEALSTRIIQRASMHIKLKIKKETDIEKLISLLSATGIEKYREYAETLRRSYYEEILVGLHEAGLINKPVLAVGLLELHNNKIFKEYESLSGIISLNHDNLFQVASQKVHKALNLGFNFTSDHVTDGTRKEIPLILHLHGSFSWLNELPIRIERINAGTEYSNNILWIPPTILKEATAYPYNKLMGLAYDLLLNNCNILRIIGCSLSQNDWNLISLLFNSQYAQLRSTNDCFKIELIMSKQDCDRIDKEYSYLKNIVTIDRIPDGNFDDYSHENDVPPNSELRNPFKYWLKEKTRYHISKKQFDRRTMGKTLKSILEA